MRTYFLFTMVSVLAAACAVDAAEPEPSKVLVPGDGKSDSDAMYRSTLSAEASRDELFVHCNEFILDYFTHGCIVELSVRVDVEDMRAVLRPYWEAIEATSTSQDFGTIRVFRANGEVADEGTLWGSITCVDFDDPRTCRTEFVAAIHQLGFGLHEDVRAELVLDPEALRETGLSTVRIDVRARTR